MQIININHFSTVYLEFGRFKGLEQSRLNLQKTVLTTVNVDAKKFF